MARTINVEVRPKRGEPIERTIRRFSKKVKRAKIVEAVRDRLYYEKPSVKRRKNKIRAQREIQKQRLKDQQTT